MNALLCFTGALQIAKIRHKFINISGLFSPGRLCIGRCRCTHSWSQCTRWLDFGLVLVLIRYTDHRRFSCLHLSELAFKSLGSGLQRRDITAFFASSKMVVRTCALCLFTVLLTGRASLTRSASTTSTNSHVRLIYRKLAVAFDLGRSTS